jgi:uncharacterized Zn finger protein
MNWFRPYVSVAERKAKAEKKLDSLRANGCHIEPLGELSHRMKIATSFWGRSWCEHLESFSDYENRLPRGRTYVRNGSVMHLAIESGHIHAMVQGSELYELKVQIDPLPEEKWQAIQTKCRGKLGSLIELLQGKISSEIMAIVTDKHAGLFPSPKEIHLNCNCPDWATMCKHVAAVLYGVGARLDSAPELLFKLRGVDHEALISAGNADMSLTGTPGARRRRTLDAQSVSDVFGISVEESDVHPTPETTPISVWQPPAKPEPQKKSSAARPTLPKRQKPTPTGDLPTAPPTGHMIKALRIRLGMSRSTFAKKIGLGLATLMKCEHATNELTLPSESLKKFLRLYAENPPPSKS